jgi:hypothetical protein
MRLLFVLLLPALAFGQATIGHVYLRTGGTGYCTVTGATNATPIVITVSAIGDCRDNTGALLTTGSRVSVMEVEGNLAANSYAGSDTDYAHLCRTVRGVSGNTLQLYDCNNTNPIAGSGSYTSGGRVGHATRHTVSNAGFLSIVTDPAKVTASNPMYPLMQAKSAEHVALPAAWGRARSVPEAYSNTSISAMRCRADNNAAACAAARYDLQQISQLTVTACDENYHRCGVGDQDADYNRQYHPANAAKAIMLMEGASSSALDSTDKANIAAFVLGDKPWTVGGLGPTGATPVVRPFKILRAVGLDSVDVSHGTVTWPQGSTTITGSGTHWNTVGTFVDGHSEKVEVGDTIEVNARLYGTETCKVAAVVSDTQITCTWPGFNGWTGVRYAVAPPWQAGDVGAVHAWQRWPSQYKKPNWTARLPNAVTEVDSLHNLTHAGLEGSIQMGLALCMWNARGCVMAARNWDYFYDEILPAQMSIQGPEGRGSSNMSYTGGRVTRTQLRLLLVAKTWLSPGEQNLCSLLGTFCAGGARLTTHGSTQHPGRRLFFPIAEEYANFFWGGGVARGALYSAMLLGPSHPDVRAFWDLARNRMGAFDASFVSHYTEEWYEGYDPSVVSSTPPLVSPGPAGTNRPACIAIWGTAPCTNFAQGPLEFASITSRNNWSTTNEVVKVDAASGSGLGESTGRGIDHGSENASSSLIIMSRGNVLVGNDTFDIYGVTADHRGGLFLNGLSNLQAYPSAIYGPVFSPWRYASSTLGAMRSVSTGIFKPAANASYVERAILHFPALRIVIDWARMAQSSPGEQFQQHHFGTNGCGTPASSTCLSASLGPSGTFAADHGTNGVVAKFLGLRGTNVRAVATGADDFSYSGQAGYTGRIRLCPDSGSGCNTSASSSEWVSAFGLTDGGTTTAPTVTNISNGALGGVQVTHGGATAAALFTTGGATVTSGSFTVSAAARVAVVGVASGSYSVTGATCGSTTVFDSEQVLECTTAAPATVSFSQIGLPLAIDTASPLPAGTVGTPYSQTLAGSGGSGTGYTWAITAGSLPPGTSINSSTGAITGTPTTAGTYAFTIRLTDSASGSTTKPLSITIGAAPGGATGTVLRGVTVRGGGTIK